MGASQCLRLPHASERMATKVRLATFHVLLGGVRVREVAIRRVEAVWSRVDMGPVGDLLGTGVVGA